MFSIQTGCIFCINPFWIFYVSDLLVDFVRTSSNLVSKQEKEETKEGRHHGDAVSFEASP